MINKETRIKVFNKFDCNCAYCSCDITLKTMQIDHVISKRNFLWHIKNNYKIPKFLNHLTESDVDHIDNLFPSCIVCNRWKKAMDLETFRSEIKAQLNRLNRDSAAYRFAKKYGMILEITKKITFYFELI